MKQLRRFRFGQRVVVTHPDDSHTQLHGRSGVVVRLRIQDTAAWVDMDQDLPDSMKVFLESDGRHRHVMLWPDECEEEL